MTRAPLTSWQLRAVRGRDRLDIRLVVDTTAPAVVNAIEAAAAAHGVDLERVAGDDPRFGELIGENELAGLAVAFKALVLRAGGRVEITEQELLEARARLAQVDATPELMTVQLIAGTPPDGPRFGAEDPT